MELTDKELINWLDENADSLQWFRDQSAGVTVAIDYTSNISGCINGQIAKTLREVVALAIEVNSRPFETEEDD
jgi:hypothetical protein